MNHNWLLKCRLQQLCRCLIINMNINEHFSLFCVLLTAFAKQVKSCKTLLWNFNTQRILWNKECGKWSYYYLFLLFSPHNMIHLHQYMNHEFQTKWIYYIIINNLDRLFIQSQEPHNTKKKIIEKKTAPAYLPQINYSLKPCLPTGRRSERQTKEEWWLLHS